MIGLGLGCSYSPIFDIALGGIDPDEAGSASGSLSSIQQLASGLGSAAVTSVFFETAGSGFDHAVRISLIVVMGLVALSVPLVVLMPRRAPAAPEETRH
ncbi:hypothetical protein ACQEU6_07910 [Spirillospora sp. CA-108201]